MKTTKKAPIGISLLGIKTEQFAVFPELFKPKKETELLTSIQFKVDTENNSLAVFAKFEFTQGKQTVIKIEVSCHFGIDEESWKGLINKKSELLVVPKDFLAHLAMITVGTSRGVLHAKLQDVPILEFIIPTINVVEMVSEDMQISLAD